MDTRGVIAEYDGERYTLTLGSQGSHIIRDIICGDVLKLPLDKMRVITPDVGGGFGTKLFPVSRICAGGGGGRDSCASR